MGRIIADADMQIPIKYYDEYYDDVKIDYDEMMKVYPFSSLSFLPTAEPSPAIINVVAVNKSIIDSMHAAQEDFTGKYNKELKVIVPFDFKKRGCLVYGGSWIDVSKISESERHFYTDKKSDGRYLLCLGVPESFQQMDNVILENVKTAENLLIAYEKVMRYGGRIYVKAYAHGKKGEEEFRNDRNKYVG